jgi:single-strand DNA-binding protein
MAGSLNKVMLIGNLGKDPEFRAFEGGGSLTRFPIATSETYTSKQTNEKVTNTEWHNVVLRNKLGEVADKYLKKGDKVFIEGRLKTRSWEDQSGERKYATEVHADNMTMLGGARGEQSGEQGGISSNASENEVKPQEASFNAPADEDDDLPF